MSILVILISFLISGFSSPLFKEGIKEKTQQIETCASGGCVR